MKLNQRELELKTLKCIISFDGANDIASEKLLKEYHFLTKEPGVNISLAGKLYTICQEYASTSGGCKVTETVLESLLMKKGLKPTAQSKFLNLWYSINECESSMDEFPHLIQLMKDRYCVTLLSEMTEKNAEFVVNDQIKDAISSMTDYVNAMTEEQEEFQKDKVSFNMAEASNFFFDEFDKRLENPDLFKGISCGLSNIDSQTFGWMPSQFVVFLAPSSGGKSVQLLNCADHAHTVCKKNVIYFSFEMSSWLCMLRHTSLRAQVEYSKIKSLNITSEEKLAIQKSFNNMENGPYFEYVVSIEDPTPEFVEQKIKEFSNTKGMPELIVVDYIGNMTTRSTSKNAKHWEKNGDAAEGLFKLAKRYNLPILTAQQINRESIKENRKNKENGKAAAYYQDAASGDQRLIYLCTYAIGLEPNKEENLCWYHPVKMRDAYFVPFAGRWIPEYNKILELSDSQQSALNIIKQSDPGESNKDYEKPIKQVESIELDLSDWADDF